MNPVYYMACGQGRVIIRDHNSEIAIHVEDANYQRGLEVCNALNALAGRNAAALAALEAACDNIRRQGDAGWPVPANSQAQDDLRTALAAFRGQA